LGTGDQFQQELGDVSAQLQEILDHGMYPKSRRKKVQPIMLGMGFGCTDGKETQTVVVEICIIIV
jgi:hypothetical protein